MGNKIKEEKTFKSSDRKKKIFQKFKVKDIVFLAIMSASSLVTCAVMPLVATLQPIVFGIAHVVTGLQISLFFSIGLYKVRKPGSLLFMVIFMGIVQLMMAPAMFFSNVIGALILELLVIFIFRGYEKNSVIFFTVAFFNPITLPFNILYNIWFGEEAMVAVATKTPWFTIGMSLAVVAISIIGTIVGMKIAKELKKSGVLKK